MAKAPGAAAGMAGTRSGNLKMPLPPGGSVTVGIFRIPRPLQGVVDGTLTTYPLPRVSRTTWSTGGPPRPKTWWNWGRNPGSGH